MSTHVLTGKNHGNRNEPLPYTALAREGHGALGATRCLGATRRCVVEWMVTATPYAEYRNTKYIYIYIYIESGIKKKQHTRRGRQPQSVTLWHGRQIRRARGRNALAAATGRRANARRRNKIKMYKICATRFVWPPNLGPTTSIARWDLHNYIYFYFY